MAGITVRRQRDIEFIFYRHSFFDSHSIIISLINHNSETMDEIPLQDLQKSRFTSLTNCFLTLHSFPAATRRQFRNLIWSSDILLGLACQQISRWRRSTSLGGGEAHLSVAEGHISRWFRGNSLGDGGAHLSADWEHMVGVGRSTCWQSQPEENISRQIERIWEVPGEHMSAVSLREHISRQMEIIWVGGGGGRMSGRMGHKLLRCGDGWPHIAHFIVPCGKMTAN